MLAHYNPSLPYGLVQPYSKRKVQPYSKRRPCNCPRLSNTKWAWETPRPDRQISFSDYVGLKWFHLYMYGRHFTIQTDNKPLERIFNPKLAFLSLAAMRFQRWATTLPAFNYSVRSVPSSQNAEADALSRLLSPALAVHLRPRGGCLWCWRTSNRVITHYVQGNSPHATRVDSILSPLLVYAKQGWPQHVLSFLLSKIVYYGAYE